MKKSLNVLTFILLSLFLFSCMSENQRKNKETKKIIISSVDKSDIAILKLNIDSVNKKFDAIPDDSIALKLKFAKQVDSNFKELKKQYALEIKSLREKADKEKENTERENIIAEKKWNNSKAGRIYKKHPDWSKEDCELIANNKIWIGMHIDMVKIERGLPNKVNTSNYGNGNEYQYVWEDYSIGYFYCKEDRIVTSYN